MKTSLFALVALTGISATTLAAAADDVSQGPMESWTGAYGGLSLGGREALNDWRTSDIAPQFASLVKQLGTDHGAMDSMAARLGVLGGYNWQVSPTWLIGAEANFGWANNKHFSSPAPGMAGTLSGAFLSDPPVATVKESWDFSLRGRVGTLVTPDTLLFATAGPAFQRVSLMATCKASGGFCTFNEYEQNRTILFGGTIGAGLETKLSDHWHARFDYSYADFFSNQHSFFKAVGGQDDRFTAHLKTQTHTLNAGIVYQF